MADEESFNIGLLRSRIRELSEAGVYLGTSSWKYPGWCGQVYTAERYTYRGRFSEARFERTCLEEYAATFPTVCVDAAYYTFPRESWLQGLAGQVPDGFRFSFKVTDEVTIRHYPRLPRFGPRGGTANPNFLNPDLFCRSFLGPLERIRPKVGLLIFEFSHFHPSDFSRGRDFVAALDRFLGCLPPDWSYGVEIRNRNLLHPEYFAALARHGVSHVFNSWTDMPAVSEQLDMPGSVTCPSTVGCRLLLRPGRTYQEAVTRFAPYDRVRDEFIEGREAGARLIADSLALDRRRTAYLYVNNRFEGNAPLTIAAMIERARKRREAELE